MYKRPIFNKLKERCLDQKSLIQVLLGPRQVGKTTLSRQLAEELGTTYHYASADEPGLKDHLWIGHQWERARFLCKGKKTPCLLILDEVQKLNQWSETVKKYWDEDQFQKIPIRVLLLGSSKVLLQNGLTESLAGRFEIIPIPHWTFGEMKEAFGLSLDQYIYFGGYPGSASFREDEERWRAYILDSLVETTIAKDILFMTRIEKPTLLRKVFYLGCEYSGKILSYQKMLGQLQDAGNTTTLAHYLDLLDQIVLVKGLQKYRGEVVRQRASSPKLQVYNSALLSAIKKLPFSEARSDPSLWGHYCETAIGQHLLNQSLAHRFEVFYWRERNQEVDFILKKGKKIIAIEVKSGGRREVPSGLAAFVENWRPFKQLVIGLDGIPIEEFLLSHADQWF